jgi:hypothetical protein
MSWRKWIVRGLVFSILAGVGGAVWLYERWTNPAAVRQQVIDKLRRLFPGANVTLDSARLRLLGGISLSELRLTSNGDADEVLHVPSAVLYHDKEQLLDGVLTFRKVELHRPRLRLVRRSDGKWNIDGLAAPSGPQELLPTIVVHQGTLILEDRLAMPNLPAVEVNNVSMTLINDPSSVLAVDGSALSDTLGTVQIHGTWHRATHEASLAVQVQGVPLCSALVQRVAGTLQSPHLAQAHLTGKADIRADLEFKPDTSQPICYDLSCKLTQGTLTHPQLCMPLEDLEATLHVNNSQIRLEQLTARSGMTEVRAHGSALMPNPERDFEVSLEAKHFHICANVFDHLPEPLQDKLRILNTSFQPVGPANLTVEVARRDGNWTTLASGGPPRIVLNPENLNVVFKHFQYPVERLSGSVELNLLTQLVTVNAVGYAGSRPVSVKGRWHGRGSDLTAKFDIQANHVPIDAQLIKALPASMKALAKSFHPSGKVDIRAEVRRVPGDEQFYQEYHARLHGVSICWDEFRYPLENLTGWLHIYPQQWEFRDIQATHNGGEVLIQGRSTIAADGSKGLALEITGRDIAVDDDLRKSFVKVPGLAKAWDTFAPSGRMTLQASIDKPGAPADQPAESGWQRMAVTVTGGGCTVTPVFFPYAFDDVRGRFQYRKGRLDFSGLTARHHTTTVGIDEGYVDFGPEGGYYAKLKELRASQIYTDDAFLAALPPALKSGVASLKIQEPVELNTKLIVTQAGEHGPVAVWWDGALRLDKTRLSTGVDWRDVSGSVASSGLYQGRQLRALSGNLKFDKATLLNQPFNDLIGHFEVKESAPEVLNLNVSAPFFGGELSGPIRLDFRSPLRYEMNLTASQVNLQEFGRHNLGPQSHLQGLALGRLHLVGEGGRPDSLEGNGRIEIPAGRLYNLPILLDLIKFLGLRWPDRTFFEEGKATFSIHGHRAHMDNLELIGNAVSFYGQGDFNLDGTDLKLDFYPTWGRVQQLVPPVLRGIPAEIGKNMLKVEMRGKVTANPDDLKLTKIPIPVLLDPLFNMRDRMNSDSEMRRDSRNAKE